MPEPGVANEPGVRRLERLGELPDRDAARGGEQQYPLQRLTGPQPVGPVAETRRKHGELRGRLEPRIARLAGRPAEREVAERQRAIGYPRAERAIWYPVRFALAAAPLGELRPVAGVVTLDAIRRGGQVEHPLGRGLAENVQRGAFQPGRLHELGEHAGRHRLVTERVPVRVPLADDGEKLTFTFPRAVPARQPYRGEQQGFMAVRKQP